MRIFVILLFLLNSIIGISQYYLKGKIRDYSGKDSIMGCSVLVLDPSDSLHRSPDNFAPTISKKPTYIKGVFSNYDGVFFIDNIPIKNFDLMFSFIGFKTILISNINYNKTDSIDLGNVYLFLDLAGHPKSCSNNLNDDKIEHRQDLYNIKTNKQGEFMIKYPKQGEELKMRLVNGIVTIDFAELLKHKILFEK
jgi:hypothetical protein